MRVESFDNRLQLYVGDGWVAVDGEKVCLLRPKPILDDKRITERWDRKRIAEELQTDGKWIA